MTVSGVFADLHVYMKVLVDGEEWLSDYMCCNKNLKFTLQVSAICDRGIGFQPIQLEMLNMDRIEFSETSQMVISPGASASIDVDYGTNAAVEKVIQNFMTLKTGKLLMRDAEGSTIDALKSGGNVLDSIVMLNSGHRCLTHTDRKSVV